MLKVTVTAPQLDRDIADFVVATGRSFADVAKQAIKSLVRYALDYTPPASGKVKGVAAKRAGEVAINSDLYDMGFEPVKIKGFRMINHVPAGNVKGRKAVPIDPVRVATKLNPQFADPEAHHRARLLASRKRRGLITRGGTQAFYVDKRKFSAMRTKLFAAVGKLASGWVPAALELGIPVPAFIKRHAGSGRGTTVKSTIGRNSVRFTVINHFPPGTDDLAADVERRITIFTGYVSRDFQRQLAAKARGLWKARP